MRKRVFALLMVVALLALPMVAWADGVCPCPENTVSVAKCEWSESAGAYICNEGDGDAIAFGNGTDASGGTWTSEIEIAVVVIKGSTGCYTYNYDPAATDGNFSNEDLPLNPGGQRPDISHVGFCKPKPTAVTLRNFSARSLKLPRFVELLRQLWPW